MRFDRFYIQKACDDIENGVITLQDLLKGVDENSSPEAKEIYAAIGEAGCAYSRLRRLLEGEK